MTPKQMRMRQALMALYLEAPGEVAKDVTNAVMDAIDELEAKIKVLQTPESDPLDLKFPYGQDPNL